MGKKLETSLSVVLTAAALLIAVTLAYREFFSTSRELPTLEFGGPPRYLPDWRAHLGEGLRMGDSNAPIQLIEFADLECPFCRVFHESLKNLRTQYGDTVLAFEFIHFPLRSHRFARPAARAAECANELGRFAGFVDVIFAKQDSLGLKSFMSYATEAGIGDTLAFHRCATDTVRVDRIERGLALGQRLGVRATPTVIINGWLLSSAPPETELDRIVSELLAGRPAFTEAAMVDR